MTDYYENCRWFLRENAGTPYVEVTRAQWLLAENSAGFRGGGVGQPATSAWTAGNNRAGVIVYPHEDPPLGAIEWGVTYEWGYQFRPNSTAPWGAVWESYENEHSDAEDRARDVVERHVRFQGHGTARVVRRRVVRRDWEGVE